MPFSKHFYPKWLTVMCAYILRMDGLRNRTHYPGVKSSILYQLNNKQPQASSPQGIYGMLLQRQLCWIRPHWALNANLSFRASFPLTSEHERLSDELKEQWAQVRSDSGTTTTISTKSISIMSLTTYNHSVTFFPGSCNITLLSTISLEVKWQTNRERRGETASEREME